MNELEILIDLFNAINNILEVDIIKINKAKWIKSHLGYKMETIKKNKICKLYLINKIKEIDNTFQPTSNIEIDTCSYAFRKLEISTNDDWLSIL